MAESMATVDADSSGAEGPTKGGAHHGGRPETLPGVLRRLSAAIFFPDHAADASDPPLRRIGAAFSEHAPLLPDAVQNTAADVLRWAAAGSPLRVLLVSSVGTIALVALTGLLIFMLFFVVATINAIIICFLISLALLSGFVAFFFTCVTAIYIGALSVAAFVISAVTVSFIVAVMISAGWIGFFWLVWLTTAKCMVLAKQTLGAFSVGSAKHRHEKVISKNEL